MQARHRLLGWAKDDPVGTEFADVGVATDGLRARGVALGTDPVPYRVDYELCTGADYVTTALTLTATGNGRSRRLGLARTPAGRWTVDTDHAGATELPPPGGELSPLFNSMPVLRHALHESGESVEFLMVGVPARRRTRRPLRQHYPGTGHRIRTDAEGGT